VHGGGKKRMARKDLGPIGCAFGKKATKPLKRKGKKHEARENLLMGGSE